MTQDNVNQSIFSLFIIFYIQSITTSLPAKFTIQLKFYFYSIIFFTCNIVLTSDIQSSIFKIQPEIERIFLHTRATNQNAISSYEDWGFTKFEGKLPNWTDLEYLSSNNDYLQKIATEFIVKAH